MDTSFCPNGHGPEEAAWDYGPDPRGYVGDPVAWVRRNARGLGPEMTLRFVPVTGSLEDIVLVTDARGTPLAYVDFSADATGAYFPVQALLCRGAGIVDFTS